MSDTGLNIRYDIVRCASEVNIITVTKADGPLSCPMPTETLWDAHPRIYLVPDIKGKAKCPYCGAQYQVTHFEGKEERHD